MNTPLLDAIAKAQAKALRPSEKPVAKYRNGQPKPQWLQRAEDVGHVVKEFQS